MKNLKIPFDQTKLILSCIFFLLLFMIMPAICLYVSIDPLLIFFLLTICWFTLKAAIRAFKRLVRNKAICELTDKEIFINSLSNEVKIMNYKDIEKVTLKEKRHCLQFIIFGEHVEHASGFYMIHIDYPFARKKLETVKSDMIKVFAKHHIQVEELNTYEKEVNANV